MENSFSDSRIQKNLVGNNAMEDLDVDQPELVVKKEQGDYSCSSTSLNQGCNEPSGRSLWRVRPPSRNSETCSLPKSVNECMPSTSSLVNVKEEIKVEYEFEGDSEMPCASKDSKDILGQSVLGSELLDSTESNGLDNNSSLVDISIKEEIKLENESEDVTVIPYSSQTSEDSKEILEHFIEGGVDILDTSGSKELDKHDPNGEKYQLKVGERELQQHTIVDPVVEEYAVDEVVRVAENRGNSELNVYNNDATNPLVEEKKQSKPKAKKQKKRKKDKIHKCNVCDYTSSAKSDINKHMSDVHPKVREKKKCEYCEYSAKLQSAVRKHINAIHLKIKPFKCESCDYITSELNCLRRHVDCVHLKLKKFKCEFCEHTTGLKGSLKKHIAAVHTKKDKPEDQKVYIKRNQCPYCDFAAKRRKYLTSHVRHIHDTSNNFKCAQCDYNSPRESTVRNHFEAVHLKLKKHKCSFCDFRSSRLPIIRMHVQNIHKEKNLSNSSSIGALTNEIEPNAENTITKS